MIVIGGGLAGLAATHRLAANGLSVALVEKRERLGGSSAMSGGWFALSGTALQRRAGVEDSDALFVADMVETGGGFADEALLHRPRRASGARGRRDRTRRRVDGRAQDQRGDDGGTRASDPHPRSARVPRARGGGGGRGDPAFARGRRLVWDGARVHGIRSASGDLARARRRRPHERGLLALPQACRAVRAGPGRGHAVRRRRQHRATVCGWPGCWALAWPTSGTSPAPTDSTPRRPTTSTSS